jgi:hypothetical protein
VDSPSTEGSLSDIATFTEANGDQGILFDAVEYLSGNVETTLDYVFVNDSEITARQLDQGKVLVVPTEMRGMVAAGITFDPESGVVTSAISAINNGTRVTASGQLTAAANDAKTVMDTDYSPVPEELVNVSDVVNGIERDPKTGRVTKIGTPMTSEQVTLLERADTVLSTLTTGANVDEDRATQIARVIYAKAIRSGITTTPRRAFSQAILKLLERQNLRPQVLSTDLPSVGNSFSGDTVSVEAILEEFEGARRVDEAGYGDEPSLGRVEQAAAELSSREELINRLTTLRHARLIVADPDVNNKTDSFLAEHVRNMLALRRRLSSEGKLKGFTQEEIANFTFNVLRDLDKSPVYNLGEENNRSYYSTDPDSIETSELVITNEDKARTLGIVREVINKYFPGIREVILTDGKGRMHVDAALGRTLFVNVGKIAEVIQGLNDADAEGFIRSLTTHEYFHLGMLRKVGVEGLQSIGDNLTDAQLDEAADIYFSRAVFANEAERVAAYNSFKQNRVSAAIEYVTMLAERMRSGQSVQEMAELSGLPQSTLKRILSAIKTVLRRFETHVRLTFNPALREQLNNLQDGVRELDELIYGESVYPERDVELREAPEQYSAQVGQIFESYKSDSKRGSGDRRLYRVSIPGNPARTTLAKDADTALRNAVARLLQDEKRIFINNREITDIRLANSLLRDKGSSAQFAKPEVPKDERTLAKAQAVETKKEEGKVEEPNEKELTQGMLKLFSYSPDTRVRLGKLGPEKGGIWSNIKSIFKVLINFFNINRFGFFLFKP